MSTLKGPLIRLLLSVAHISEEIIPKAKSACYPRGSQSLCSAHALAAALRHVGGIQSADLP